MPPKKVIPNNNSSHDSKSDDNVITNNIIPQSVSEATISSNNIDSASAVTAPDANSASNNSHSTMEMMNTLKQMQEQSAIQIRNELSMSFSTQISSMMTAIQDLANQLNSLNINVKQIKTTSSMSATNNMVPDTATNNRLVPDINSPGSTNVNYVNEQVSGSSVSRQNSMVNNNSLPITSATNNMVPDTQPPQKKVPENGNDEQNENKFNDDRSKSSKSNGRSGKPKGSTTYNHYNYNSNVNHSNGEIKTLNTSVTNLSSDSQSILNDRSNTESDNETESVINTNSYESNSADTKVVSGTRYNPPPFTIKFNEPKPVKLCRRTDVPDFHECEDWTIAIKDGMESVQTWLPLLLPIPQCFQAYSNLHYMLKDDSQVVELNYLAAQRAAWKWIMDGFPINLSKQINREFEKNAEQNNILGPGKLNFQFYNDPKFYKNCHQLIQLIKDRYGGRKLNLTSKLLDELEQLTYNNKTGIPGLFNSWRKIHTELETYGEGYKPMPVNMQIPQLMKKLPDYMEKEVKAIVNNNNLNGEYKTLDQLERYLAEVFPDDIKRRGHPRNKENRSNADMHAFQDNSNGDRPHNGGGKFQRDKKKFNNKNNNSQSQYNRDYSNADRSTPQVQDTSNSTSEGNTQNNLVYIGMLHVVSNEHQYESINTFNTAESDSENETPGEDDSMSDMSSDDTYDDTENINATVTSIPVNPRWKVMLDSGASVHATPHRNLLQNVTPVDPLTINLITHQIKDVGNQAGELQISDKHKLSDVRFIKGAQYNIASVARICDAGHTVVFGKEGCWILNRKINVPEKNIIISGKRTKDNLYFLDGSILSKEQQEKLTQSARQTETIHYANRQKANGRTNNSHKQPIKPLSDPNKGFSAQARRELTTQRESNGNTENKENNISSNMNKLQHKPYGTIPKKHTPLQNNSNKQPEPQATQSQATSMATVIHQDYGYDDSDPDYVEQESAMLVLACETIATMSIHTLNDDTASNDNPVNKNDTVTHSDIVIIGKEQQVMEQPISKEVELFHYRLAHPGIDRLIKANQVYELGLNKTHLTQFHSQGCQVCHLCKTKRAPINHVNTHRTPIATRAMGCWHADLMGPFSSIQEGRRIHNRTIDNESYLLVIVDEYSRYYMVIPLAKKSDAAQAIINQIKLLENLTSLKLQTLHTDGGGEFLNSTLEEFLTASGINLTTTTRDSPQLNSIVERANQTLTVNSRCMMNHADSPMELCNLAYKYSAQIHNLLPSKSINYEIPAERFLGKESNRLTLKHLKVFGCDAYAKIEESKTGKLQPTAKPYIFIGFSPQYSAYKLLNPETLEIIIDRNVHFDEFKFTALQNAKPVIMDKVNSLIDSDPDREYEVERILARDTTNKGKRWYLVQWKNYANPTWEPEQNLTNCKELLSSFNDTLKKARKYDMNVMQATILAAAGKKLSDRGYVIPQHYRQALCHPDREKWQQAIRAELDAMKEQSVFIPSILPSGRKSIGCRWVFDVKRDAAGNIVKFKARLVIQGFSQEFGKDYYDTFSPTVKTKSIKFLLAIAAQDDLEIQQLDFKTAFLNASLDEEIFMKFPDGYDKPEGNYDCLKLDKALYGLKQAPRAWWLQLDQFLINLGYKATPLDECLYFKKIDDDKFLYLTVYVDDTLAFYPKSIEHIWLQDKNEIIKKYKIDDIGEAKWILKMEIIRDRINHIIRLSQTNYVNSIFENLVGIDTYELKPSNHPFKYDDISVVPDKSNPYSQLLNTNEHTLYRSIVGSLLYAANITRIDLSFIVGQLARYCTKPTQFHLEAAKQALRYVKGSTDLQLEFHKSLNLDVIIYTDSSWGDNRDDRKGTGGHITMFNNRPVAWQSKKHSTTPLSSTEAEYYALANAVREALFVKQWFKIYREDDIALKILCDNLGAIQMSDHTTNHNRTKHIDIQYYFIREHIRNKDMRVEYINTNNQLADILTKSFRCHPVKFIGLVNRLLAKTEQST